MQEVEAAANRLVLCSSASSHRTHQPGSKHQIWSLRSSCPLQLATRGGRRPCRGASSKPLLLVRIKQQEARMIQQQASEIAAAVVFVVPAAAAGGLITGRGKLPPSIPAPDPASVAPTGSSSTKISEYCVPFPTSLVCQLAQATAAPLFILAVCIYLVALCGAVNC